MPSGEAKTRRARHWWALAALLAGAGAMRMAAVGWGLPPTTAEVAASDIRSSYAFDEDDILTPLSFTRPAVGDFDPRQYQWGTLHLELVLGALETAERLHYFGHSWRKAYYDLLPGDFERVYRAGRLVSVLAGVASIGLMYLLGREYVGGWAALWAAALVAVSPAHLLGSAQIRVDLTMTALLILTVWLAVRVVSGETQRRWSLWLGLAAGAAVAAKYTAIFIVLPVIGLALWAARFKASSIAQVLAGATAGFLAGEPYLLIHPRSILEQVSRVVRTSQAIPEEFRIPAGPLLGTHAMYVARFLVAAPAALLAVIGIILLLRRQSKTAWIPLAMLAGGAASLAPLLWPMLRYELPLLPPLALAAALALERCPSGWKPALGAVALLLPLAASIDQLRFMRAPHPANRMLAAILQQVPRGTPIARLMAELPPLDRKVYPMGPNPMLDDLSRAAPAWVLMTDLPDRAYPQTTTRLLAAQYDRVAEFAAAPLFAWATLGAARTPHDWKYPHPRLALYRRRLP